MIESIGSVSVKEFEATNFVLGMNEDIRESLKDIYPDEWKELFLFSVFRLLNNTPIKNLQTYYDTSFLSETLPGAYLSSKKVGKLLRDIGKERKRTKAFLRQFISGNDFALDLTLKWYYSLSAISATAASPE